MTTSTTDLVIGGMTCASCASRVERKLNRLDGVTATVNFATEAARVSFPETLTVGDLIAAVERTGYTAALPAPPDAGRDADAAASSRRPLRLRMLVSVALAKSHPPEPGERIRLGLVQDAPAGGSFELPAMLLEVRIAT